MAKYPGACCSALAVFGLPVEDRDGQQVGTVSGVYVDVDTGRPVFVAVHQPGVRRRARLVPLAGGQHSAAVLRLPYPAWQIRHAPKVVGNKSLTPNAGAVLYDYYGLPEELSGDGRATPADQVAAAWRRYKLLAGGEPLIDPDPADRASR